ncbi:MAG: hypothetical protein QM770_06085 [Tepidisphaeraceae bacterium]
MIQADRLTTTSAALAWADRLARQQSGEASPLRLALADTQVKLNRARGRADLSAAVAHRTFETVLSSDGPSNPRTVEWLTTTIAEYTDVGQIDTALRLLDRVGPDFASRDFSPTNVEFHCAAAQTLIAAKRYSEAASHIQLLRRLMPTTQPTVGPSLASRLSELEQQLPADALLLEHAPPSSTP